MSDRKDQKREAPISYRPPRDLRDEFRARVEKSGLSTNAFITKAVFRQPPPRQTRRPPVEAQLLAKLLSEAARVREALHEVERAGGEAGNTLLMERAVQALTEIRAALLKGLGRLP